MLPGGLWQQSCLRDLRFRHSAHLSETRWLNKLIVLGGSHTPSILRNRLEKAPLGQLQRDPGEALWTVRKPFAIKLPGKVAM